MKKFCSVFLSLVLIILSFPLGALSFTSHAANDSIIIWTGLDKAQGGGFFSKGDGSAENPYIIENGDQLYLMIYNFGTSDIKINGKAAHYKLGCDIYLNDISNYDSWGKAGFDMSSLNNWTKFEDTFCHRTFYGNFNGDGHTIYGLYASSYRVASFFPNVGHDAVVRNVSFKNSYVVNTSLTTEKEQEDDGETTGQKVWYAGAFGAAGVLFSRADGAGDSDYSTVDFTINNCSVIDAYIEAKYFTSAFVASANSCQPYIANCMTAGITLNSTSTTQGVEGAIINMPYGSTNPTLKMDNILAVGYPIYGVGRNEMWSGKKAPAISHTYTFTNVYSTVSNKYTFNHSSYGNVSFTDSEVTVVDAAKLIGAEAEKTITAFDWAYTWRTVEGGYPVPMREYVMPSGNDYYKNGGPKYTTDQWDGTVSSHFAAGDGSVEDPYLIANCEEFYRMITSPQKDKHYKIANGVTDLYFNDIEGKNYSTLMSYFSWGIGQNYDGGTDAFEGCFDGNGVTMHGVRASNTNQAALFTLLGTSTLKNFTVKYSYFKTSSSSATGAAAIAAEIKENSIVQIKNVAVIDSNVEGKTTAAGFVGKVNSGSKVQVENCIVSSDKITSKATTPYQAAFIADGNDATISVKNCISLGIYPASNSPFSYNGTYTNVYTDTTPTTAASGVTKVENSALQGETAKQTCPQFNWNTSWCTTATIPMPRNQQNENGVVGTAWSGEIAMSFAGGEGTKSKPYLINTAEMLARMLVYGNAGEYYKLTANIYINDVSQANWQNGALEWFTSSDVSAFEGSCDGNGYTIYGLYANVTQPNEYAALMPVIGTAAQLTKIKLDNAYLTGSEGAYLGGIAGVLEDNAAVMASISASLVNDNVIFSGQANVGGIVANVGFARLKIENCVFRGNIQSSGNSYGICENVAGELLLYEIVCINNTPFDIDTNVITRNVYTNAPISQDGVIVLTLDKMTGIGARNNLTALDYSSSWRLTTDNTPEPMNNNRTYNGVKGEVWSGRIASGFAGGNGTENNPYIIATGEQLALMISKASQYENKHFKLECDIYLNNVNDDLWQARVGAQQWLSSYDTEQFKSHLDGNGHVVFGMYYNFKATPQSTYMGLIPRLAGSAQIKNIGVSQAYVKAAMHDATIYAGGLFGMGSAFYNFYGNNTRPHETEGDEFLIPGQTTPTKLPSFTNCFVDHTCHIEATSVGGIGCPGGAAVVVRDCYVTASLKGESDTREGGLLGSNWANCSRVYNSFAFTQTDNKVVGGNQQWIDALSNICMYTENVYYYGTKPIFGTTRISRHQWRIGEAAQNAMDMLDWENTWRIEPDGTPVLCVFDKEGRGAEQFSDKYFTVPDVKISFETNADDVVVEDITSKPYEKVNLPTPQRDGYKFVAWHSFSDLTCEYEYDFFLARDITLYAEWQEISVTQNFENYTYTDWDCDKSIWRYNTPTTVAEYKEDCTHDGKNSMQLMTVGAASTLLLNYRKTLTAGQVYTISMWVSEIDDSQSQFALAHKMYPDYMAPDLLTEPIADITETDGVWKKYTCTFTAQSPWVAIKVLSNSSLYIDDVVINLDGELLDEITTSKNIAEGTYYQNTYQKVSVSNAESIGEFAFAYGEFVTDVFISSSVKQIDDYAFFECNKLTDVWYSGSSLDFEKLIIGQYNNPLRHANWHFNSCGIGQEHMFDNACDSICNNCQYEREVPEHVYDDDNDKDCNICGAIRDTALVGDVNCDGKINNRDYAVLLQYLNKWDVEINQAAADVNGDGKINNRDYAVLLQYLNKWDVTLGPKS